MGRGLGLLPWRTAAGAGGVGSEAPRAQRGPCSPPSFPPAASGHWPGHRGAGAGSGGSSGPPPGLRRLHLAAVPHASLGMEVMEEIPEGETLHFQACLEDPGWEGAG